MNLVLSIALTHISSRIRQTFVGVFGVAIGVGFSVLMASLMEGSQKDFIAQLVDSLPHISISDDRRTPSVQPAANLFKDYEIYGLTSLERRRGIKNPLSVISNIESWAAVKVAPSTKASVLLHLGGRDVGVSLIGIDPKREVYVSNIATKMIDGSIDDLIKASNAVLIGAGLADRFGVKKGNTLTLAASNGSSLTASVAGIFKTGVSSIDEGQIYALIRTGQVLAGQNGLINEIRIKTQNPLMAKEIASRIEADIGYKTVSWQEAHEDLLNAFNVRNFIMYTVVGAILLVASFGVYNIISTITHEKTRDIAILKSLGFPAWRVRRIFLLEAVILGAAGAILGSILGFEMNILAGKVEFHTPAGGTHLPVIYEPLHYFIAGGIAMASSIFAAWLPATKASNANPVDIIRGAS